MFITFFTTHTCLLPSVQHKHVYYLLYNTNMFITSLQHKHVYYLLDALLPALRRQLLAVLVVHR
jgi:hypothetical protein